ncbi:MAG: hypothetical protein H2184_15730 [Candidatus Galacturonibacter soehngenii]|nr:hypothetical protein [Candidatus Galacturonibacter soehngenii]
MIQTYSIPLIVTETGDEVFPGYMDNDYRKKLREHYDDARGYMYCGCREDQRLYYRISEDLKVYPEKNGQEHSQFCQRYRSEDEKKARTSAYVVSEKDGEVTAYLAFNPKNMVSDEATDDSGSSPEEVPPEGEEIEEELIIEGEVLERPKEEKEPKLGFKDLVRSINIDTYTDLALNNRKIAYKEKFNKAVYFRMKKIRPARSKKAIGELTIEEDGVRFMYTQLQSITAMGDSSMKKYYINTFGADGKVFKNLIFEKQLIKAGKEYVKMYGEDPNEKTMVAAFQYLKKSRAGNAYRVLGRVHFFQVSDSGIYCRNEVEKEAFNEVDKLMKENADIKMWFPADDPTIGAIINVKGKKKKILLIFKTNKNQVLQINKELFEPIVIGAESGFSKAALIRVIEDLD